MSGRRVGRRRWDGPVNGHHCGFCDGEAVRGRSCLVEHSYVRSDARTSSLADLKYVYNIEFYGVRIIWRECYQSCSVLLPRNSSHFNMPPAEFDSANLRFGHVYMVKHEHSRY